VNAQTLEPGFVAKTMALIRKDLRIEARARETLLPMIMFAFTVTLLLSFTLPGGPTTGRAVRLPVGTLPAADVIAGFLWVTVLFAGLIGAARSFEVEREHDALESLLLAPLDRSGVFISKVFVNLGYVILLQLVLVPAFTLLFDLPVGNDLPTFLGVLALVDVGFALVATTFAALAARTRSRELLLPILALPALVPIFIAAVELTSSVFVGETTASVAGTGWFGVLVAFDVIFGIAATITFEFIVDP
jgi:heme exporter protein B